MNRNQENYMTKCRTHAYKISYNRGRKRRWDELDITKRSQSSTEQSRNRIPAGGYVLQGFRQRNHKLLEMRPPVRATRYSILGFRLLHHVKAHLHTRSEIVEHLIPNQQPLHEPRPEVIVEGLWAILARGGFVEDFSSANFSALLGKERYTVVVKARDISHVVHAGEFGDSDRRGIGSGYRRFCLKPPAACDCVDAHGVGGEESRRDEKGFEPLLQSLGVVFVEDSEGVREGIKVGDRGERDGINHSEENLEVPSGIVYIDDWESPFTFLGRLWR